MSETGEHQFLKQLFHMTLRQFSSLRIFGIAESERRKFDLSCVIECDWSRPLVGQVAWRNTAGLDKDLRTLVTDRDSEIKVILAADTMPHRKAFHEILGDFRRSGNAPDLFRLRAFWLPAGLSADSDDDRATATAILREQIVSDLLLNVVFGNLTARDMRVFLVNGGISGLGVAILHHIAVRGFVNISALVKDLQLRSATPVREKLILLHTLELLSAPDMATYYEPTVKGKVVLELLRRVHEELQGGAWSSELIYLLERLGCAPMPLADLPKENELALDPFVWLLRNVRWAQSQWGISWPKLSYEHAQRLTVPGRPRLT